MFIQMTGHHTPALSRTLTFASLQGLGFSSVGAPFLAQDLEARK